MKSSVPWTTLVAIVLLPAFLMETPLCFAEEPVRGKQIITVAREDGTSHESQIEDNNASLFTFNDDGSIRKIDLKTPAFNKVIVKFREIPLIKLKGKTAVEKRVVHSGIERIHGRFDIDVTEAENRIRHHRKEPALSKDKIVKRKYKHVFNGTAVEVSTETLEEIRKLPYVEEVYPDLEVKANLTESVAVMNVDDVWNLGFTGDGVVVAVIDTGIDYSHADLGGTFNFPNAKIIGGYDCYNNDPDPKDDHGHGTHVAGIVAGNGTVKGVAYQAKLMAFKVLNASGSGPFSVVIDGIERACDPDGDPLTEDQVDVINLSLGGPGTPDDPICQSVDNAVDAGVVVTISAGNSGSSYFSIGSPGLSRKGISVAACDKTSEVARYSSRGPVPDVFIVKPDVTAVGSKVNSCKSGGGIISFSGTSMAAPHVAGIAALILEKNPNLSAAEVKYLLMGSGLTLNRDVFTQGSGKVDAARAFACDTIVVPPSHHFGTDDEQSDYWYASQYFAVTNKNPNASSLTYSLLVEKPLPEGMSAVFPDTLMLDPVTGTGSFNLQISVDNRVLPDAAIEPFAYDNALLLSNGDDTFRCPFAFIKAPVITIAFDKQPYSMVMHDRGTTGRLIDIGGNQVKVYASPGVYDIVVYWSNPSVVVVKENVLIEDRHHLEISSEEAIHTVDASPFDSKNQRMKKRGTGVFQHQVFNRWFWYLPPDSFPLKFSSISTNYTFDWTISDFAFNDGMTHDINGSLDGISQSHMFTNYPSEYVLIDCNYPLPAEISDLCFYHFVGTRTQKWSIAYSPFNDTPSLRRVGTNDFKRLYYVRPADKSLFLRHFAKDEFHVFDPAKPYNAGAKLANTPVTILAKEGPFAGLYRSLDTNATAFVTYEMKYKGAFGPPFSPVQVSTQDTNAILRFDFDLSNSYFISLYGDATFPQPSRYLLYDANQVLVREGELSKPGTVYHETIPLPVSYKKHSLVIPFTNYYIAGIQGNARTTHVFNASNLDEGWPPFLRSFKLLSNDKYAEVLDAEMTNKVVFVAEDFFKPVKDAHLKIKSSADEQWIDLELIRSGNEFQATIPDIPEVGPMDMKVSLSDIGGNSMTQEWYPGFIYLPKNLPPVANAGPDQLVAFASLVELDGSGSSDVDGFIKEYSWDYGDGTKGSGQFISHSYATPGTYSITLTVTDNKNVSHSDTCTIQYLPVITLTQEGDPLSETSPVFDGFIFSCLESPDVPTQIFYQLSGVASNGVDFSFLDGTLTLPAGQNQIHLPVNPVDDPFDECTEDVIVTLSSGAGYFVGDSSNATNTISDNDFPEVSISTVVNTIAEGAVETTVFRVYRRGCAISPLSVNIAFSGTASNGVDFAYIPSTITIPAEFQFADIQMTVMPDAEIECGESIVVTALPNVHYSLTIEPAARCNIADELSVVSLSAQSTNLYEEAAIPAQLTISRNGCTTIPLAIDVELSGTAINGVDYLHVPSRIVLAAGISSTNVVFTPIDDSTAECRETIQFKILENPEYIRDTITSRTVGLADNDLPSITVVASDVTAAEDLDNNAIFTINRQDCQNSSLTVYCQWTGSATNKVDYSELPNPITFPPGVLSTNLIVSVINDLEAECPENVIILILLDANYSISQGAASATILDDDFAVSVHSNQEFTLENLEEQVEVEFSRNGCLANDLIVPFNLSGTAINGTDYNFVHGSITIPASSNSVVVPIIAKKDSQLEGPETILLKLQDSTNGSASSSNQSASITILDGAFHRSDDWNMDGRADLWLRNPSLGKTKVWIMDGTNCLRQVALPSTIPNSPWRAVAIGDFNLDLLPDIVWRNIKQRKVKFWVRKDPLKNTFYTVKVPANPIAPHNEVVAAGYFREGSRPNLLWRDSDFPTVLSAWVFDTIDHQDTWYFAGGVFEEWDIAGVGDFNGDGYDDILQRNTINGENQIRLTKGFSLKESLPLPPEPDLNWKAVSIGDFDGDGYVDIVWRNFRTGQNRMWFMEGHNLKSTGILPFLPLKWEIVGPK